MTTTTLDPDLLERAARRYHDLGADALARRHAGRRTWPTGCGSPAPSRPTPSCCTRRWSSSPAPRSSPGSRPTASGPRSSGCSPCSTSSRPGRGRAARAGPRRPARRAEPRPGASPPRSRPATWRRPTSRPRAWRTPPRPTSSRRCSASTVLPNLAAAAHAPIFLYHLPRVAPRGEATPELLRPLARELARHPGLGIEWVHDRPATRRLTRRAGGRAG